MMENRLIHYNLADFNDPTKYNARNAQANSTLQDATHVNKLLSTINETQRTTTDPNQKASLSQQAKLVGANAPVNAASAQEQLKAAQTVYGAAEKGNQSSLQNGQTYNIGSGELQNAAAQRLIDSGMSPDQVYKQMEKSQGQASQTMTTTGQGVQFDQNGNVIPGSGRMPAPTPSRGLPRTTDTSTLTPITNAGVTETPQEFEQRKAAVEQQNTEKLKQQQIAQEKGDQLKKFTAGVDPAPVEQTKTQIDELMASIKNLSPDLQAAVLPSLIGLQQSNNDITKEVNNIIGSQPTDEEIQANYGSLEKYIQSEDAKYKALIERNMQTSKEVATYNRDMLEAEKAIIEHDASVAEQKQVIANAEGEKQLRRQLNRLGIQTDVQGLTYLQTEVQKGVDALENLKTANNLVSLKAQLAIGEGYRLEVKQAMETYEGNYLNITSQTTERLNGIKNSISTAKADRNKEIKEARKWGLEQKNENDRELRATVAAANKTMNENMRQMQDDASSKEQMGWQIFNTAFDNYKGKIPQAILNRVSQLIPGLDVNTLAKGGQGAGGGGRYGGSPGQSNGVADSLYSGMSAQQLKEAVDRVTLNFGGTGAERNRKRGEYLSRINAGEPVASIVQSMQADYWASQKGAPRTAHDGRIEAQASADSLQSFVDFYSIDGADDGPLGQMDSRIEGFKSIFGQSSEEYNNLANNVGNIRARIIKENYGAAVTPQELAIAKSYIPDMTDKGNVFVTQLQNLKSYNAYLDAKVFNSSVGLPPPKPPLPVTISGSAVSGPGKFSNEDILSVLSK